MSNVTLSIVALLAVLAGVPCAAQDPNLPAAATASAPVPRNRPRAADPAFRTSIDLVALTVTVTDARRKFINNLTASDFQVFEDGVQQPVSFFGVADVPLDVALLVDGSASMVETLPLARAAAKGLLQTLRTQDRASLVEFRNTVRVSQPLTNEVAQVAAAVDRITASGGTSLHNALYVALKDFQKQAAADPHMRRQAIVVLSDGEDTGSLVGFDEVLQLARRSGVTIYTVALRSRTQAQRELAQRHGRRYFSQADYSMRVLAEETGARAFFPDVATDLKAVYDTVAAELAAQYALGYVSRNPVRNGAFRRLLVRVTPLPGMRPRTRTGYFADASTR